ncbi:topology modulation protein [Sphingomonas sp. CFBP8993]|uniref:topology modulation protein n=1 Tax=Sphingomonas sp. CFBP8993 TaxID=3096526 RepID=UPI002A6A0784|nr:topology modulation protein [Sphingomonas sp. CFBP8993]MDY0958954.1 topology modulation protein [Sphingomonas sp. CFBP8993]
MPPGPITRIMVMGPPGSGKSTLARMLGERLGLPVHHADALFHDPGWVARPREDFIADMVAIAAQPAWVIDGNYSGAHYGPAIADRLARAERIILLDLPRRVTIPRILRRVARHHGQQRPDSAAGCPERLDWAFLGYCWQWRRAVRPGILRVLAGVEDRVIWFRRSPGLDRVLADMDSLGLRLSSG